MEDNTEGGLLSVADFAKKIKSKYPQYNNIEDSELVSKMIEKYPEYADKVDLKKKEEETPSQDSETPSEPSQESGQSNKPSPLVDDPSEFPLSNELQKEKADMIAEPKEKKQVKEEPFTLSKTAPEIQSESTGVDTGITIAQREEKESIDQYKADFYNRQFEGDNIQGKSAKELYTAYLEESNPDRLEYLNSKRDYVKNAGQESIDRVENDPERFAYFEDKIKDNARVESESIEAEFNKEAINFQLGAIKQNILNLEREKALIEGENFLNGQKPENTPFINSSIDNYAEKYNQTLAEAKEQVKLYPEVYAKEQRSIDAQKKRDEDYADDSIAGKIGSTLVDKVSQTVTKSFVDLASLPRTFIPDNEYGLSDAVAENSANLTQALLEGGNLISPTIQKQDIYTVKEGSVMPTFNPDALFAQSVGMATDMGAMFLMASPLTKVGRGVKLGKESASKVGMFGSIFAQTHNGSYEAAIEAGATPQQASAAAIQTATVIGGVNMMNPMAKVYSDQIGTKEFVKVLLSEGASKKTFAKGAKKFLVDSGMEGLEEASEVFAEAGSNYLLNGYLGTNFDTEITSKAVFSSYILGSIGGGIFSPLNNNSTPLQSEAFYQSITNQEDFYEGMQSLVGDKILFGGKETVLTQEMVDDYKVEHTEAVNRYKSLKEVGFKDSESEGISISLLQEKMKLEKKLKTGVDDVVKGTIKDQIETINEVIKLNINLPNETKEGSGGVPKSAPETKNENNEKETKKAEKAEVLNKPVRLENPTPEVFGTVERNGEQVKLSIKEFKAQNRAYRKQQSNLGSIESKAKETESKEAEIAPEQEIEKNKPSVDELRANEQQELIEAIPEAKDALTDGKVDREKLPTEESKAKFDEIYDKYDKLISPLLNNETVSETTETESGAPQTQSEQANVSPATVETQEETDQEKPKVNTVKAKGTQGKFEYDVDIDENGEVVEIRGKGGRVIPQFNKAGRVNNNYSKIEANALGQTTINQDAEKRKQDLDFALSQEPTSARMAALQIVATGEMANAESISSETGAKSKKDIGITNPFAKKNPRSLGKMAEDAIANSEYEYGFDDTDVRDELIKIFSSVNSITEVQDEILSNVKEPEVGIDPRENMTMEQLMETLSEEEKAFYNSTQDLSTFTEEELNEFYEKQAAELSTEDLTELFYDIQESDAIANKSNESSNSKGSSKEGNKGKVKPKKPLSEQKGKNKQKQTPLKEQSRIATGVEDLIQIGVDFFGLSKAEATANAIATDVILKQKAKRDGISVEEMYSNIEWRKGNEITEKRLKDQANKPLFQGPDGKKNFEAWKGDNKEYSGSEIQEVKTGEPVVLNLYHGTTNEFYEFDSSVKGNIGGHLGKVNYFTSEEQDASQNYQSSGPDLTSRIQSRQEALTQQIEDEYSDFETEEDIKQFIKDYNLSVDDVEGIFGSNKYSITLAKDKVSDFAKKVSEKELLGNDDKVLDLYVKLNNPVVLGNGRSWIDVIPEESYEGSIDDAAQEIAEEYGISEEEAKEDYQFEIKERAIELEGVENPLIEALDEAIRDNTYDGTVNGNSAATIITDFLFDEEIDLNQLEKTLREELSYAQNEDGDFSSSQIIADFFKNLGYDGIILTDVGQRFPSMNMGNSVSHVHVFDEFNNQIKLADGSNVTFGDTSDIRFQGAQGAMALEEGKYVIYALTNPNLSTPLHELAHVFENSLSKKEKDVVMAAYRKDFAEKESKRKSQYKRKGISDMYEERRLPIDQAWDTEVSEFFARGFEKYLADGKAPTIALKKLFENFKTWLNDIYNGIKGSEIDIKLSPRMIEIYDSMFTGRDLNNQTKTKATLLEEGIEQLKTTRKGVDSKRFGEILFTRLDAAYNNGEYTEAEYTEKEKEITDIVAERSVMFQLPKDSEIFKDLSIPRFVVERAVVFLKEKYDSGMTYAESLEATVEYLSKKGFKLTPEQRNKFIDYVDGLVESQKKELEKERKKNRNKEEQPEAPKSPAQRPQAFTTRSFKSKNLNKGSKETVKKLGLNYDVESQDVAQRNAEIVIAEVGLLEAYKMANEGEIRGGARTWIQAVMFEEINEQVNEAYAKGNLDLVESLSEELGVIIKKFANEKTLNGQEAAMLNRVYQRFDMKYDLDFAKEKWAKKFDKKMTPEVEAILKRQEERIKDLNQQVKDLEEKIGTIEEQEAIENIKEALERQKSKFREETKITKRTKVQPIIDKLDAIQKKMLGMSFNDATGVSAIIVNGIGAIKAGIKVGANAYDVIESGINRIKEELDKIGKKLPNEDEFRNDLYDAFGTQEEPKVKKDKSDQSAEVEFDEDGNFSGIKIPEGLIYELVEGGIDNISDLTTAVKEQIIDEYPEVSDREVRDAITKYGKQVNETIDPIKQEISRIRTDGKQASILEDLYLGKRPKKSGRKGKKYTEEQRNNLKKIQELLKTIPLDDSVDKEKYYKTALEAYKTRLEKSIADFDQALATNERIINERRTLDLDQEAKDLVAKRDAKRKEYDEHFGKPFKSNETLIKEIIGRKEKTLKDLEVRLETVKLTGKEMPKKQKREVYDPKIDALQEKIDATREELGEVYELAGIAEAKRLERAKKYSQRRLDELQEKLKNGDYTKKKPRRIKYDKELVDLKRKLITEKVKFDIEFEKQEWKELNLLGKLGEGTYQAFGVFKGLKATADLSAMLRQGILLGSRNPREFARATAEMHKFAFGSIKNREKGSEYYARRNAEVEMANDYVYMMEDGLSITDMSGDILRSEERFVGKLISTELNVKGVNVNIIGRITDGSERAYGGFLNSLRVDVYRKIVAKHEAMGYNRQDHPKLYKNIAKFVNNATGRGKTTSDKAFSKFLNALFFSPKMITGMVGVVRDMGRKDSTPYLRWQAAQSLGTFITYQALSKLIIAQAYQLLVAPFLDDDEEEEVTMSMNAIDTEFNKVKIGNTRYDVSAGYGIAVRTAARFIMDEKITGGVRKDFAYNETEFAELSNFFSNKMSPLARQIYNWKVEAHPTDFTKERSEAEMEDYLEAFLMPLSISQLVEGVVKEKPFAKVAFDMTLATYGVGVQEYGDEKKKKKRKYD